MRSYALSAIRASFSMAFAAFIFMFWPPSPALHHSQECLTSAQSSRTSLCDSPKGLAEALQHRGSQSSLARELHVTCTTCTLHILGCSAAWSIVCIVLNDTGAKKLFFPSPESRKLVLCNLLPLFLSCVYGTEFVIVYSYDVSLQKRSLQIHSWQTHPGNCRSTF